MAATGARWGRRLAILFGGLLALLVVGWVALRVPDTDPAAMKAKYGGAPSQFVEVAPGLTVHLRDQGPRDAPVLVLLHGSNASLHTWEPWVQRLTPAYRVVTFDFPGHGLTGAAPDGDYSTAAYVRDVDAVAAKLGLGHFVLGGNSMGGGVALAYTIAHPDKVDALILVDAAGAPVSAEGRKLPIGFRIARTPVLRDVVEDITPRAVIEQSIHQTVAVQSIVTPAMVDRYWELLRYPGNRAATLWRFRQPFTEADPAAVERITAPTLILWGREDKLIPVASAEWFAAHIKGSQSVILDGVGHVPMEEAPDASMAPVRTLLDQASSGRTAAK
jgi:pimeloyl-ACP methyl ester carboxylesterase